MIQTTTELMTVKECASELRVCEATVRTLVQSGKISGFKVGHRFRIRRREVEALLGIDKRGQEQR